MKFPLEGIRTNFPALALTDQGRARIYADNPAGTQVPAGVAQAVAQAMLHSCANLGGHFVTSLAADQIVADAHADAAMFVGAQSAREIVIGQSMTSLTFHVSRSICQNFQPGDEIVITRMEHEGNVAPWLEMARDKGLTIRWVPFDLQTWKVEPEALAAVLADAQPGRMRLVCLNYASNMTGSVNDIPALARLATAAGALVYVDAVQLAPHHLVDVQALGCDFLVCSAYKFFGPHLGVLWGREEVMLGLHPYKGRCVSDDLPDRFEAGTPQVELLAGLSATVGYFVDLGRRLGADGDARACIAAAYKAARAYEERLTLRLVDALLQTEGVRILGITNSSQMRERVPTVSLRVDGHKPSDLAQGFADAGIFVWHGHNYAYESALQLGLPLDEGVVRIGLAHYNTDAEVDCIAATLEYLVKKRRT